NHGDKQDDRDRYPSFIVPPTPDAIQGNQTYGQNYSSRTFAPFLRYHDTDHDDYGGDREPRPVHPAAEMFSCAERPLPAYPLENRSVAGHLPQARSLPVLLTMANRQRCGLGLVSNVEDTDVSTVSDDAVTCVFRCRASR